MTTKGLLTKTGAWLTRNGLAALLVLTVGLMGYRVWKYEHDGRVAAELQASEQRALNDSTQIVQANDRLRHKREMQGLIIAANEMNGRLVAAMKLVVAQRDTHIVHVDMPTVLGADSSRTAQVNDSTFAGKIVGTITAPKYPAPLSFDYKVIRPEFSPEIGFVRVGNKTIATVVWQGETFKIENPYFDPKLFPEPRFQATTGVGYDVLRPAVELTGGVRYRLPWWKVSLAATGRQRLDPLEWKGPSLILGAERRF